MRAMSDPFTRLFHAYGPATDTPAHLRALTGEDDDARAAAVRHLWSAVLHQGTPWMVTPVVVVEVVEALRHPGVADPELQVALLEFLAEVATEGTVPTEGRAELEGWLAAVPDVEDRLVALSAEGRDDEIYEDPDATGALLAQAALGCRDALRLVLPSLAAFSAATGERADDAVRAALDRTLRAVHEVLTRDHALDVDRAVAALHPVVGSAPTAC